MDDTNQEGNPCVHDTAIHETLQVEQTRGKTNGVTFSLRVFALEITIREEIYPFHWPSLFLKSSSR